MPDRIGIIGNTQGVNDSSNPKPRKASTVETSPPLSMPASASIPPGGGAQVDTLDVDTLDVEASDGAPLLADAAPPPAGASSISNVARSIVFDVGG